MMPSFDWRSAIQVTLICHCVDKQQKESSWLWSVNLNKAPKHEELP
jgi:hypothetical protein